MFKRRATLDSNTLRPNLQQPPEIVPTPSLPYVTTENSTFSQNILQRIPSLHSNVKRVKVPDSYQTISPSTSYNSINFARPSGDYSSSSNYNYNNNNNNNNDKNNNNNNNNNNYPSTSFHNNSGTQYNSISRSSSVVMNHNQSPPPPLPQNIQNHYNSNRSFNNRSSTQSIASLYPSPAYSTSLAPPVPSLPSIPKSLSLPNIRKIHKQSPTLNLIVIGAKNTGKTSLVKTMIRNVTLVKTSIINGDKDSLNRIELFGTGLSNLGTGNHNSRNRTESITLEILTDMKEKLNLSIIDTIGLDVMTGMSIGSVGHEMELERQMDGIMRINEERFEESLSAENETFRNASSKVQDSHVHLALYFIHPQSITLHRSTTSNANTPRTSSEFMPPPPSPSASNPSEILSMSLLDIRNLKKLSRSVNVLPILARSDELTIAQFSTYKKIIKRDLSKAGVLFNPFELDSTIVDSTISSSNGKPKSIRRGRAPSTAPAPSPTSPTIVSPSASSDLDYLVNSADEVVDDEDDEEEEEEEPAVKVIKIRRSSSRGAHSRPKMRGSNLFNVDRGGGSGGETELAIQNFNEIIPFGVVAPEEFSMNGSTEKRFLRVFKYGTLDVLNPMHSDFTMLQKALFNTNQIRILKESTRLQRYEPFRTSKLIARRAPRALMPGVEEAILRDLSRI